MADTSAPTAEGFPTFNINITWAGNLFVVDAPFTQMKLRVERIAQRP